MNHKRLRRLDEMRQICEDWRRDHNEVAPTQRDRQQTTDLADELLSAPWSNLSNERQGTTSFVVQRRGQAHNDELTPLPNG